MKKISNSLLEVSRFLADYQFVSENLRQDGQSIPPKQEKNKGVAPILGAQLRYSNLRDVLEFVPAFEEITSNSRSLKPSYGVVHDFRESGLGDETEEEKRARLLEDDLPMSEKVSKVEQDTIIRMGPVGFKRETDVFELLLDHEYAAADESDSNNRIRLLQAYLVTFEAALKLAIATVFEMEEGDFAVTHHLGGQSLHWFVYSSVSGSPIAQMVFDDLSTERSLVWEKMYETIVHSTCCRHCCESCILLPRTPEFVVRRKLLDKAVVKQRWMALHV